MSSRTLSALTLFSLIFFLSAANAQAQTQVRVTTSLGEFTLELFDSTAPITVTNFLNYVTSGRFNESIVHRSVPNFVTQGGRLVIPEGTTVLTEIQTDGTIVNEFGESNLRGTIAMAKVPGNPDSATSQWFINLADNTFLDSDNGGFTVFGRVLGDGMQVVDAISQLQRGFLSDSVNELPIINFTGSLQRDNLVLVDMEVVNQQASEVINRFDDSSNLLVLSVDAGSAGIIQVSFSIESREPQVVIKALPTSVIPLNAAEEGFSVFDAASGQLIIPALEVDGQIAFRNLVLNLTDADELLFTLQSFEAP